MPGTGVGEECEFANVEVERVHVRMKSLANTPSSIQRPLQLAELKLPYPFTGGFELDCTSVTADTPVRLLLVPGACARLASHSQATCNLLPR